MEKVFLDRNRECLKYFDGISDLAKYIKTAPRCYQGCDYSTDREPDSFNGNVTFDEAVELLLHGDEKTANKIEKIETSKILGQKKSPLQFNNVQGFIPNIPNTLKNIPNSMIDINYNKIKSNERFIDIIYCPTVSASVSSNNIMRVSKILLDIVDTIESKGYRCNIYWCDSSHFNKGDFCAVLNLKHNFEAFNKYKCAFVLGHAAMFRRIGFRLTETLETGIADMWSYGSPCGDRKSFNYVCDALRILRGTKLKNPKYFSVKKYVDMEDYDIIKDFMNFNNIGV